MEVEETALPVVQSSDENVAKKGKILNLLFSSEAAPVEGKDAKKDKNKLLTKVVIRRLPPRLNKEAFLEEFSPLPPHDYFYFVRGDLSLGSHSFSRAYINFLNQDDIYAFKEKYDDYGIQDEKGKMYHAVVEFAPFQRIPRRNVLKKKLSKAGTLESETKYLEFLKKLEEYKNNASNTSEYFHETESNTLKTKVTTTPLLEFLKAKKQKKNDLKNDIKARKREQEKERKKKEEERRRLERERKKEEKKKFDDKNKMVDDRSRKSDERLKEFKKNEFRGRAKEEKKELKSWRDAENCSEDHSDALIATDPAILQVIVRQPEKSSNQLGNTKNMSIENDEYVIVKNGDSDSNLLKIEKKYADNKSRVVEDKQRKTFQKRDVEDPKMFKFNSRSRKGVPDEKGDNSSIGNWSEIRDSGKKRENDLDTEKKQDSKSEVKEAKSKFRYSEQRNREREHRSQKGLEWRKEGLESNLKTKGEDEKQSEVVKEEAKWKEQADEENKGDSQDSIPTKNRRKSLELQKTLVKEVRKRSSSLHDLSTRKINDFRAEKKKIKPDNEKKGSLDNGSKEDKSSEKTEDDGKKDAKAERRIRNKDRPSIEIYRPGMGKFSKQRLEQKKEEINPVGAQNSIKNSRLVSKGSTKKSSVENRAVTKTEKGEEKTVAKTGSDIRPMTCNKSGSKEN